MNNILFGNLPERVTISGLDYQINWDFRIGMKFESVQRRTDISEEEKIWVILSLYYPRVPDDLQGALSKIIWFYQCGKVCQNDKSQKKNRYRQRTSDQPAYAFLQDAPYIYADFKSQYGIDLAEIQGLHWWKFSALFEALGEETKMGKIMYYRKARTSGMSKERRAFINDMKKLYKIQEEGSEQKQMSLTDRNNRWIDYIKSRHSENKQ